MPADESFGFFVLIFYQDQRGFTSALFVFIIIKMPRGLKQLFYGIFYLIFWAAVGALVYFLFLKPAPSCFDHIKNQGEEGIDCGGPCQQVCLPSDLKQLVVASANFYPLSSGISLLAEIQNPNQNYAAKNFDYEFDIYDSQNNVLKTIPGSSFIYASEVKYLAIPNFDFSGPNIGQINLVIKNENWQKSQNFQAPLLKIQNQNTALKGNVIETGGVLVNNDSLSFSKTLITAVFYGKLGQIDGVSQTEADNLLPGESRNFSIVHPQIPGVDISRTQVYVYAARP